jgi:hypothetical protein
LVGLNKNENVERALNLQMRTNINWCENSSLQIAKGKADIILLTRIRVPKVFNIKISGNSLTINERIKYLCVVIDNWRNFTDHLEAANARAGAIVGVLRGLLPNVSSPSHACRKLYYQVWELVVLYAFMVRADELGKVKNREELIKAQRCALTSTSTAYRTVSHAAVCVPTGHAHAH